MSHVTCRMPKWTDEMLYKAASFFNTRGDFAKGYNGAYRAARRRGIIDKVCAHMQPKYTRWTDEQLFEEALRFQTRIEFVKGNESAYSAARRRGIIDKVCAHIKPQLVYWTDEMLFAAAAEFNARKRFREGNSSAYCAAQSRGILDKICSHMKRGTGFDPHKPAHLYVVRLDSPVKSYVGFGISNYLDGRIIKHNKNSNQEGFSLTLLKTIYFKVGKDAADMELKLKRNLPIVDTRVDGFRTEAILEADYHKLEELIHDN